MNKLLSGKALALSVLALVTSDSWGMHSEQVQDNSQANASAIIINISQDVLPKGYMCCKTSIQLAGSPSYQWFSEKGVTFVKGINIICNELKMYAPDFMPNKGKHTKEAICNCLDRHWDKLSPIFDRVKILSANLHRPKSYEIRKKKEELSGWDASSSVSVKWAKQNNLTKQSYLLSVTLEAIRLGNLEININRRIKRDTSLLHKFLDENWAYLQPFMDRAYTELDNQSPQEEDLQTQQQQLNPYSKQGY